MNIWLPADEPGCTNAFTEQCICLINSEYPSLAIKTRAFAESAPALFNTTLQRDRELQIQRSQDNDERNGKRSTSL